MTTNYTGVILVDMTHIMTADGITSLPSCSRGAVRSWLERHGFTVDDVRQVDWHDDGTVTLHTADGAATIMDPPPAFQPRLVW